jgi:S1-C subfamily serine protease
MRVTVEGRWSVTLLLALSISIQCHAAEYPPNGEPPESLPTATRWVLDASSSVEKTAIASTYIIICPKTAFKGSAFLVDNGIIVTNAHVVAGCTANELVVRSAAGKGVTISALRLDPLRDLAALTPGHPISGGLALAETSALSIGAQVRTWGHPLGYNGPPPLLSVGYLSGLIAHSPSAGSVVKHLIVNAAFNSGNSGGPLLKADGDEVIGVVVSKARPIFTPFVQSALAVFAKNRTGVNFEGTDSVGNKVSMSESQVVAEMVSSLRDMSQVMIGEAVAVEELRAFLSYKRAGN